MIPTPVFSERADRPFIFINAAMSADGKLSTKERKQVKISGKSDFDRVDAMRASCDAIMVGIGTILSDDPSLTVKSPERRQARKAAGLSEDPVRVVPDSMARTPIDADIFKKGDGEKIIFVSEKAPPENVEKLKEKATVLVAGKEKIDLPLMMRHLKERGIGSLMIEGGAAINDAVIRAGLVDEIYTFIGNLIIGGENAPTFADGIGGTAAELIRLELAGTALIEEGVLLKWKVLNG